jgi:hypothetical protein
MKPIKLICAILLTLLMLVSIAACGAPPVAMSDIPVLPKATALDKGKNMLADTASDAMQKSLNDQKLKSEVKLYALPVDVTWDQVKSFYTDKLNGGEWKSESQFLNESAAFSAIGWTRGGDSQALVVGFGPDPTGQGGDGFLMVMLATK